MSGLQLNRRFIALMLTIMLAVTTIMPSAAFGSELTPDAGAPAAVEEVPADSGDSDNTVEEADTDPVVEPDGGNEGAAEEEEPGAAEPEGVELPVMAAAAGDTLEEGDAGYIAYQHMSVLATTYAKRVANTEGEVAARDYVAGEFEKLGYDTVVQPFTYQTSRNSSNVIATKPGASAKTIIVGAHYDAVAAGNGADDNASGVGVMLEAATLLKEVPTPYTIKFVAFGAEEVGLRGSNYYVSQMTAEEKTNTVTMINLDSLAAGDFMYIYGTRGPTGFVRDLGLAIAERLGLDVITNPGHPGYPQGTTGDWSDHAPFARAGIPHAYLEATNWEIGGNDGYTQTAANGSYWHTNKDTIEKISEDFPGRIELRLSTFATLLTQILLEVEEPPVQTLVLSNDKASLTERRTIEVEFELPPIAVLGDITWQYGGKPLTEWKKWLSGGAGQPSGFNGEPFIAIEGTPVLEDGKVKAQITFDLPFNTSNLSGGTNRANYPALMGTFELEALGKDGRVLASAPIKLNAYDSYYTYDELKPKIDEITEAAREAGRYVENRVLGQSVQGRDIHFTILAKDQASVDQYVNEMLPLMITDPEELQNRITAGMLTDYKVPIWLNNIHPDEAPGVDAIVNFFEAVATESSITYNTNKDSSNPVPVTLDIDEALDNVIFLFNYTQNPDGRVLNTRANANGFDLNRDNSYQTQPETRIVTEEIAKWSPLSFLDLHGFVGSFLIEPCTPPHDPNHEFDLLIDSMVEQATAMGDAGIANTEYERYHIPYEENRKLREDPSYTPYGYVDGWDDASPAYTAVFAMHHGALGHTIEIPELNEDSVTALFYTAVAATQYVTENKERLFLNQLEIYKRGVEGIDSRTVDPYLINANNEEIGRPREGHDNFFPDYYVIPTAKELQKNTLEAYRMVEYLIRNGVKLEQTTASITVDGITYPAGTYVVNMRQAKRGVANLVLYKGIDVSDYSAMYAEIVQNFPDMRGFNSYEVRVADAFDGATSAVASVEVPGSTSVTGTAAHYVIRNTNNDAIKAVNDLLGQSRSVTMLERNGTSYGKGDFLVSRANLLTIAHKYYLDIVPFTSSDRSGKVLKATTVTATGVPAFVLRELGFTVASSAASGDVLINTVNTAMINAGKPYIGFGYSAINSFRSANIVSGFTIGRTGGHEGVYKAVMNQDNIITAPYDEVEYAYTASGGWINTVPAGAEVIATISDADDFFKAGWWPNHNNAKGKIMGFTYNAGRVNVTLFSNDLTNRAHPQHQFRLLANAIYAATGDNVSVDPGPGTPGPGTPPPVDPGTEEPGTEEPGTEEPGTEEPGTETPEPGTPGTAPDFKDLGPVAAWAGDAIARLAQMGIINGMSEDRFAPLNQVTRAQFITMLVRTFDLEDRNANVSFADVASGAWHYEYIAAGVEAGIAQGTGGGKFNPDKPITREEMAIMAANALKLVIDTSVDEESALAKFQDRGSIASYATEAVALLTQEGVINGMTESTFVPKGVANRAQAAVIIFRMLSLLEEE